MKFKIIYTLLLCFFISCEGFFESYDTDGYRDGSGSEILINEGSLIGSWGTTHEWQIYEHQPATWEILDPRNNPSYTFLENGTFTSNNVYNQCSSNNGTYYIEDTKIRLEYICDTDPEIVTEIFIDEFFFREKHIVFIDNQEGSRHGDVSKLELVE